MNYQYMSVLTKSRNVLTSVMNQIHTHEGRDVKSRILKFKPVRRRYNEAIGVYSSDDITESGIQVRMGPRVQALPQAGPAQTRLLRALPQRVLKPPRMGTAQPPRGTRPSAPLPSWGRSFPYIKMLWFCGGWSLKALVGKMTVQ